MLLKYTIAWQSDGRKVPVLWKKHESQFPRFFPIRWVLLDFLVLWEIDGENHAFPIWWIIPQDGNLMVESADAMEKVWEPIFQAFPIRGVLLPFLWYGQNDEKTCISHMMKYTTGRESKGKTPILWKLYGNQFLRFSPFDHFCYHLPCYGKLMRKHMHSHLMKCTTGWEANGKKAPILWEKY